MKTHHINPQLLGQPVTVAVVGCGGTGSAIAAGLPLLHQAMLAYGHPYGLDVTLYDADTISETNCVRQPFRSSEIGQNKAIVLATRFNAFWGLDWTAVPSAFCGHTAKRRDIIIGCVDTRASRAEIAAVTNAAYWLDCGNSAHSGQFVLGEPSKSRKLRRGEKHLPTIAERFAETVDAALDGAGDGPTCSAIEALEKQAPFVNQTIANHALALLALLFREGQIDYCGGFLDLKTGHCSPIPVGVLN